MSRPHAFIHSVMSLPELTGNCTCSSSILGWWGVTSSTSVLPDFLPPTALTSSLLWEQPMSPAPLPGHLCFLFIGPVWLTLAELGFTFTFESIARISTNFCTGNNSSFLCSINFSLTEQGKLKPVSSRFLGKPVIRCLMRHLGFFISLGESCSDQTQTVELCLHLCGVWRAAHVQVLWQSMGWDSASMCRQLLESHS